VGFIRDLPKDLLGAFRTTLEELQDADVLLHVVDAGSRDLDGQIQAVEKTLSDLDLNHIPRLLVLNKIDRVQANDVEALRKRYQATAISALRPETFGPLIECLERSLNYQKAQDGGMDSNPVKRLIAVLENAAGS
jgi:GTP-binding protein HflX